MASSGTEQDIFQCQQAQEDSLGAVADPGHSAYGARTFKESVTAILHFLRVNSAFDSFIKVLWNRIKYRSLPHSALARLENTIVEALF
jgi:hypothetical protein